MEKDNYLLEPARCIDLVHAGVGLPSLWEQLQEQVFLGSAAFVTRVQGFATQQTMLAETYGLSPEA